jgi:hypothetical protein
MAHVDLDERRRLVARFYSAGVRFESPVIDAFSCVFHCSSSAIKSDLRRLRESLPPPGSGESTPPGGLNSNECRDPLPTAG